MLDGTFFLMTELCSISRPSITFNSLNEPIKGTASIIHANIRCRLFTKTVEDIIDEKLVTVYSYELFLPFGTSIQSEDIVTHSATTYVVSDVQANPDGVQHHSLVKLHKVAS